MLRSIHIKRNKKFTTGDKKIGLNFIYNEKTISTSAIRLGCLERNQQHQNINQTPINQRNSKIKNF